MELFYGHASINDCTGIEFSVDPSVFAIGMENDIKKGFSVLMFFYYVN